MVLRNSTPGGFAYIWQSKLVGIIAIKTARTQFHFWSDVFTAVASSDCKVPSIFYRETWHFHCPRYLGPYNPTTATSMKTSMRLSYVAQLLKRREARLELRRRDLTRVQTEMVEFIALPVPFSLSLVTWGSSKLKIWSFHVVVVQGR